VWAIHFCCASRIAESNFSEAPSGWKTIAAKARIKSTTNLTALDIGSYETMPIDALPILPNLTYLALPPDQFSGLSPAQLKAAFPNLSVLVKGINRYSKLFPSPQQRLSLEL
jgi:hypothetical protein